MPYTPDQLAQACRDVMKANGLGQAYLRPIAFRGLGGFGLSAETPTDVAIAEARRKLESIDQMLGDSPQ